MRTTCPSCGVATTRVLVRVPSAPVFCNVLCATRDEALRAPRHAIDLARCSACGLLFNASFDPARVAYSGVYENALHFSPVFREYAATLATDLIAGYSLRGKRVVELGCGDGSFLSSLCELGAGEGIGYDPAFDASRAGPLHPRARVEPRLYTPETNPPAADLVCCRHVLEHVAEPAAFLRSVRATIGNNAGTVVFFEVPDAGYMLEKLAIWDLIYEHCNYFTAGAIRHAFHGAGFEPIRTEAVYGGQFLTIHARPAMRGSPASHPLPSDADAAAAEGFARMHDEKVREWSASLDRWRGEGTRVVLWGAGSKGVTFLNTADPAHSVTHIVDLNPRKHGHFVVGSGQEIVPPERLTELRPGVVVVMNPLYRAEIEGQLARMGLAGTRVVVA